jgi:hypothetical protein
MIRLCNNHHGNVDEDKIYYIVDGICSMEAPDATLFEQVNSHCS